MGLTENELSETQLAEKTDAVETKNAMYKAGLFFMILMILEVPLSLLVGVFQMMVSGKYQVLVSVLMNQGFLLAGAAVYILVTKTDLKKDLWVRKYRLSTFFLSLVALLTAIPMAQWLNVISQLFAKNRTNATIEQLTQSIPAVLGIAVIGCLPGFVEETLFRGIVFSAFRKRSILTGIVISSLSFGLLHMNFNQIFYTVYFGIVFALMVEATGSIVSTMILHMLFNGINMLVVYLLPIYYKWMGTFSEEYANVDVSAMLNAAQAKDQLILTIVIWTPFAIGGVVLTILLLNAIAKLNGRSIAWKTICGEKERTAKIKPLNIPLIIGWIICLSFAILDLVFS